MGNRYLVRSGERSALPEDTEALGTLRPEDRARTITYIVEKFLKAGKVEGENFDPERALEAIDADNGNLQLRGSANQIAAQLVILRGVNDLLHLLCKVQVVESARPLSRPRRPAMNTSSESILPAYEENPVAPKQK